MGCALDVAILGLQMCTVYMAIYNYDCIIIIIAMHSSLYIIRPIIYQSSVSEVMCNYWIRREHLLAIAGISCHALDIYIGLKMAKMRKMR